MASVSGNMKGFYRQRKSTATKKSSKKSPLHAASLGSSEVQTRAQGEKRDVEDGEYNESEVLLRQFDLNMAYGPCLGMTRLARWNRAQMLGLNPPKEIETLLKCGKVQIESLWDGRV